MSAEQNKATARRIMDCLDRRDLNGLRAEFGTGARFIGFAPQPLDLDGYSQAISDVFTGFPDSHFTVDDVIGEGDKVAVRHTLYGTHLAEYQGIPTTGKPVHITGIVILYFDRGIPVETRLNADFLGLLQQLGAVPAP